MIDRIFIGISIMILFGCSGNVRIRDEIVGTWKCSNPEILDSPPDQFKSEFLEYTVEGCLVLENDTSRFEIFENNMLRLLSNVNSDQNNGWDMKILFNDESEMEVEFYLKDKMFRYSRINDATTTGDTP